MMNACAIDLKQFYSKPVIFRKAEKGVFMFAAVLRHIHLLR